MMQTLASSTSVYLDNAATTALDPKVLEVMLPFFKEQFGNPSSIHSHGAKVKSAIERARKSVAACLNAAPSEIFFTSGGTEADNTVLRCTVRNKGIKRAISTCLEHHAVLHTLEDLQQAGFIELIFLRLDAKGNADLNHLEELLQENVPTLVTLMHGNNEVGNMLDLQQAASLCKQYGAYFHSDTVQTIGHFALDTQKIQLDFCAGAAHKFHGPKGVGFMYIRSGTKISPYQTGGAQERNMRGGTENVAGIVGLAKALEIAISQMEAHRTHIMNLKKLMIQELKANFSDIVFNGESGSLENSLYTVLNASFAPTPKSDMLLFYLDIQRVSASGGSACSSGSELGSHVLRGINADPRRSPVRFSFSKYNTESDIHFAINALKTILKGEVK